MKFTESNWSLSSSTIESQGTLFTPGHRGPYSPQITGDPIHPRSQETLLTLSQDLITLSSQPTTLLWLMINVFILLSLKLTKLGSIIYLWHHTLYILISNPMLLARKLPASYKPLCALLSGKKGSRSKSSLQQELQILGVHPSFKQTLGSSSLDTNPASLSSLRDKPDCRELQNKLLFFCA